jgi:glycosyltransferase involved in cell wall biosynthesis
MPPTVSLLIPAYNSARFIAETLASVERQTFTDYEAILIDDGSTDETLRVVREAAFDRLVIHRQANGGLSAARNAGLRVARGRYVALLDSDDVLLPGYLATLAGILDANPGIDLVYPNAVMFGSPRWEGRRYQDVHPSTRPVTLDKLLSRECTVFVSAMFRRDAIDRVGGFDETLNSCEDLDLWTRMLLAGLRITFTGEPLVRYRRRPDSLSGRDEAMAAALLQVCGKLAADPRLTNDQRQLTNALMAEATALGRRAAARRKVAEGDFATAADLLGAANRHYRSPKLTMIGRALRLAPRLVAGAMAWRDRTRPA